ncbi:MAG: hypothetical protein LUC98_12105 [Lachnospiraceae bacterium]|nr:hypothetical protein [Lachnospiraceae bacterium]
MCYTDQEQSLKNKTKSAEPIRIQVQQTETQQVNTAAAPGAEVLLAQNVETQRERQQNAVLNQEIRQELPAAQAVRTAPGIPIQGLKPAKQSFKDRRRDKKKAQAVKDASCPVVKAASYDMLTALQNSRADRDNAAEPHKELIRKSGVDGRVLHAFARGYRLKGSKNKRPATSRDARNKEQDDQFYMDYCSKDLKRRKPHLEKMVNELISHQFTPEMFTEQYLRKHMREMGELGDRMLCMDNVMKDPINAPFFKTLDPYRTQALEAGFRIFVKYQAAMLQITAKYGVDFNHCRYYDKEQTPAIQMGEASAEFCKQEFDSAISEYGQTMERLKEEQKTRVENSAKSYAWRMDAGNELLQRLKADPRLGITDNEATSQFFSRSHVFLQMGDEFYEENVEKMKMLLDVKRLGDGKPPEELYERIRELAIPRVERIMACDVDALAELTDEALMVRSEEINELCIDNMFLSDLMKLRHPRLDKVNAQEGSAENPTLRNELVAYRSEEFSYKVMMLRGLQERARALAIRQAVRNGTQAKLFAGSEEAKGGIEDPEAWCRKRLEIGARSIQATREKRAAKMKPGTREFDEMLFKCTGDAKVSLALANASSPMIRELDKMIAGDSAEAKQLRERVRDKNYYSLQYSEAELAQKNIKPNIGEALFRSFDSFFGLEAAEKMLTPESAVALLKNLGAGAGMHKGKWTIKMLKDRQTIDIEMEGTSDEEALKAAAEQNARGVDVFREVIRAQYDMITRKYGNAMGDVSPEELVLYRRQIHKDIMENQVALNMASKYPGFLDLSRPEDLLLHHRLNYYTYVGTVLDGVPAALSSMHFESGEEMKEGLKMFMENARQESFVQEAEAWLLKNDPAFKHGLDWSQGVRVPEQNAG